MNNIKKAFLILLLVFTANSLFALSSNSSNSSKSQRDDPKLKTVGLVKVFDYYLSDLKGEDKSAKTKIRKKINGEKVQYFYQIIFEGRYNKKMATLSYEDLQELSEILKKLKEEAKKDSLENSDYLEATFTTDKGLQLGYSRSKGEFTWYFTPGKYGKKHTFFSKDPEYLEKAFEEAKEKIETLKTN